MLAGLALSIAGLAVSIADVRPSVGILSTHTGTHTQTRKKNRRVKKSEWAGCKARAVAARRSGSWQWQLLGRFWLAQCGGLAMQRMGLLAEAVRK